MRGLVAALISMSSACFQPLYHDGLACGPEGGPRCPPGQSCVDGFCRASNTPAADAASDAPTIDGDPTADADGDGVSDAIDNCPARANPTQHDEDADALGDACDPCPHFDWAMPDTDGDGVGDDCDPSPAQDTIIHFAAFDVPDPTWTFPAGSWQITGDGLVQSATVDMSSEAIPGFDATTLDVLRVDFSGEVVSVGATGFKSIYHRFGRQGAAADPYHLCAIDNAEAAAMSSKVLEYWNGADYLPIAPAVSGSALAAGQEFFIALGAYFSDQYAGCYVELADDAGADLGDDAANLSRGGVSLHTKSAAVRFEYYIAIGH